MNPKISVILPVYNGFPLIMQSIKSVMIQTFQDFELIIINDGSTDKTNDFLKSIKHPKIKIINQENHGVPYSLNVGLREAKGKYITWTSHDNYFLKDALRQMNDVLDKNPESGFVYTSHKFKQNKYPMIAKDFDPLSFIFHFPGISCFMWKKELSDKVGSFDENLMGIEDFDYWIRLIHENSNVMTISNILYVYDDTNDPKRMTNIFGNKMYELEKKLANKILNNHGGKFNVKLLNESYNSGDLQYYLKTTRKKAFIEVFSIY